MKKLNILNSIKENKEPIIVGVVYVGTLFILSRVASEVADKYYEIKLNKNNKENK